MGHRLYRLLYHSRASFPADPALVATVLRSILRVSRTRNKDAQIGGALMFGAGCFDQVLEGPEEPLSKTFANLKQDDRHTRVSLLALEPITERGFIRWSMGYVGLDPTAAAEAGSGFDPSKAGAAELLRMLHALASDPPTSSVKRFNPG